MTTEELTQAISQNPNKSAEQVLNEVLSTVPSDQVKTVILDAVNDIINLKNLQNVVITINRANSNYSGQ